MKTHNGPFGGVMSPWHGVTEGLTVQGTVCVCGLIWLRVATPAASMLFGAACTTDYAVCRYPKVGLCGMIMLPDHKQTEWRPD